MLFLVRARRHRQANRRRRGHADCRGGSRTVNHRRSGITTARTFAAAGTAERRPTVHHGSAVARVAEVRVATVATANPPRHSFEKAAAGRQLSENTGKNQIRDATAHGDTPSGP